MPDTIIESVLNGDLDSRLLIKWLNYESLEDTPDDCILNFCNRNEFGTCFLSFLRNQTDSILQTNSNAVQIFQNSTPEKLLSTRRKHHRSISDPTSEDRTMDNLSIKTDRQRCHESPSKDRKRTGRRVKTKLFNEEKPNQSVSSDESKLSTGVDRLILSSTPLKNGFKASEFPNSPISSPVTPRSFVKESHERCDTPRLSHRHSRSQEKSCLGDYMVNVQKSSKKRRDKRISSDNDDSKLDKDLDLSNSEMFPEIGVRKANSLKSEKRRIKPTNIDKSQKSISLNSFSAESIHTSPLLLEENSAFKQQRIQTKESNSFEVERSILKQERHKLLEKFNILNTSAPQKPIIAPQIKITQKSIEKCQNFVKSDVSKVIYNDKLNILVDIYKILLENNLIMSVHTEIYFLISILISKQCEDDYISAESKLKENDMGYLLKTIHNSTYFAVKSLWNQRVILEVILDKSSLKTLGENKKVRTFYPELAKFLLNCYGLRCEADSHQDKTKPTGQASNGVICFNFETDNADNFPSMLSFQNFKKQRDMFYEILRWYQDTETSGNIRTSLRSRVKALLSGGSCAANHAHLAGLFTQHMLQHCLPTCKQESKLSKLQRRLTCPTATESHRLPHFTANELFYKEFIINAESESFRVHLRDTLSSEIIALDAAHLVADDRNSNIDITKEYLVLSRKLVLLSKFLGFLASLPYSQVTEVTATKGTVTKSVQRDMNYAPPKEKVLHNDLALRNYSQPTIDLQGILVNASNTGRLSISVPWIAHYLSMLDYTTLRINYYHNLIKLLFEIYRHRLKLTVSHLKKNTVIYLKSILGWLFDLPHFPQELFYEDRITSNVVIEMSIDCCDLVDESVMIELCPHLRDLNVLLSTCRVSQDQKEMGSYRHITPVSLSLNHEDRLKNKEKELQTRLEEEFLKSQPSSTRRVLELVIERVTSAVIRELTVTVLCTIRDKAREKACSLARTYAGDQAALLSSIQQVYQDHLQQLRTVALSTARPNIQARAGSAVGALVAGAPPPLVAYVARGALARLAAWLRHSWRDSAVLCKDIEAEMKTFVSMGAMATSVVHKPVCDVTVMTSSSEEFEANNVSPATCIISLKEQVCTALEGGEMRGLPALLARCVQACAARNVFARPHTQRALLQLSLDLCVVYVSRRPEEVTDSFLSKLHAIWNVCCPDRKRRPSQDPCLPERRAISPDYRNFEDDRAPTPDSDEEGQQHQDLKIIIQAPTSPSSPISPRSPTYLNHTTPHSKTLHQVSKTTPSTDKPQESEDTIYLELFDRVLCPRNIMLLSNTTANSGAVWNSMSTVLVFMLNNDYLSEDSLTEQCLAVYRQDWAQNVLESLSTCMKTVSARWSRCSTGKFTLFLDFLAEYCGNMDYEPLD